MKIITDNDTREFLDTDGDKLVLLASVRHRDAIKREEMESTEALESLKGLGMGMKDAIAMERELSPEERAAALERRSAEKGEHSPAVRRFMLSVVAIRLTVAGQEYGGNAIVDQYDRMDPASAKWIDEQVDLVWSGAIPGDAERER